MARFPRREAEMAALAGTMANGVDGANALYWKKSHDRLVRQMTSNPIRQEDRQS